MTIRQAMRSPQGLELVDRLSDGLDSDLDLAEQAPRIVLISVRPRAGRVGVNLNLSGRIA